MTTLRVCLDLNVLVANLLAGRKGRRGTACQTLVAAVGTGHPAADPLQLVISWGMLDRLEKVLRDDLGVSLETASRYRAALASIAAAGPLAMAPSLTLGGTGLLPLDDPEDGHVLDTALAGQADWLVTSDFRGFLLKPVRLVAFDRLAVHRALGRDLWIAHPYTAAAWTRAPWRPPSVPFEGE